MSSPWAASGGSASGPDRRRPDRRALLAALLLAALVAVATAPALAQSDSDDSPPTLENVTRTNGTTLYVYVADETGVNDSSIDRYDFTVDPGEVRDLDVIDDDGNVWVRLRLQDRVTSDVSVNLTEEGSIADDAGNVRENGSVVYRFEDDRPPDLANVTRGNATTIELRLTDDTGVDESSITAGDFALSDGILSGINVTEETIEGNESDNETEAGPNATVDLYLANPINTNNVTVSLTDSGSIADDEGNVRENGSITLTGMDGRLPRLDVFRVERINWSHARIVIETDERLSDLLVSVDGPRVENFNESDFSESDPRGGGFRYERTLDFSAEGQYNVYLLTVTDTGDNEVGYNERVDYLVDRTPPEVTIDGPTELVAGEVGRLRADVTGEPAPVDLTWQVDGTPAGSGNTTSVQFVETGTHTVTATATDGRNNTGTARTNVTVVPGASTHGVSVSPGGATGTATVAADRREDRVRIAEPDTPLAERHGVAVDAVTTTFPENRSVNVTVTVRATARDFAADTGRRSVGTVVVDHDNATASNATIAFTVEQSALLQSGLDPEEVALYRSQARWRELPTRVRWETDQRVAFEAESPGLSTFAIGAASGDGGTAGDSGDGEGSPAISVTDATVHTDAVDPGGLVVVTATVTNAGEADGTRPLVLTTGNETVATRSVTVPAGENRTVQFGVTESGGGTYAVNGTEAGAVTVQSPEESGEGTTPEEGTRTETGEVGTEDGSVTSTPDTDEGASEDATDGGTETGSGSEAAGETATEPGTADGTDGSQGEATGNATATEATGSGLPFPLSLWPDGIVGTVLGALVGLIVVIYGILKALAIYLGY